MKKIVGLLSISAVLFFGGCSYGQKKDCTINADEVKNLNTREVIVLDVRTPEEYNSGHLKDAKLINVNDNNFVSEIARLDKDQQYYVYCRSGKRSAKAQDIMQKEGFKNVCNIEGGALKMQDEGIEFVK